MSRNRYHYEDMVKVEDAIRSVSSASLMVHYTQSTARYKADGSIVTEADLDMQHSLTAQLAAEFPKIEMLGEEINHAQQAEVMRSGKDFWCLDPVDGTTNFHATIPLFSVSLALISEGEIVLAIVYDPTRDEFFSALKGQGFWINNQRVNRPAQPDCMTRAIAAVDFKRLQARLSRSLVEDTPYKSQRNLGSCALEWAWLAAGRFNLVLHGSEKFWDYAAGVLLAEESGCMSATLEGEPVFNNSLDPRSVVAASNPPLFQQWSMRVRTV